jgi:hypothetical protein
MVTELAGPTPGVDRHQSLVGLDDVGVADPGSFDLVDTLGHLHGDMMTPERQTALGGAAGGAHCRCRNGASVGTDGSRHRFELLTRMLTYVGTGYM